MASKYDSTKVYEQLDRIPTEDLKKEFLNLKAFVQKRLESEQKELEERANHLQQQIESL